MKLAKKKLSYSCADNNNINEQHRTNYSKTWASGKTRILEQEPELECYLVEKGRP